jgi:hypothetical protein
LGILNLSLSEDRFHGVKPKDRTVFTNKIGAVLTMPAETDGALHVALHRDINLIVPQAALLQL